MGSMFRSEEMVLCQMFIQSEVAYPTISELGETACVQFRDLNNDVNTFQRKLVSEVRRCQEMERKINYIQSVVIEDGKTIPENPSRIPRAPKVKEICNIEALLDKSETEIFELTENCKKLESALEELSERRRVLEIVQGFFSKEEIIKVNSMRFSVQEAQHNFTRLNFIAGVIDRQRQFAFERMLWRIARGNVYVKTDLQFYLGNQDIGHQKIVKNVFIVFFQGDQLRSRIVKVCAGFHAKIYDCPNSNGDRLKMIMDLNESLRDIKTIIAETKEQRTKVINYVIGILPTWKIMVKKINAIYHTLNKFNINVTKNCLIGECWVPVKDLPIVQKALTDGRRSDDSIVPSFLNIIKTNEVPPTYNRTNKFTQGFQNLIDAYGVASYREANPALYSIITFPFLFAVMFGDLGHGLILFIFGAWMCWWESNLGKKRGGEIWNIFFGGRYIILLMGIFSMYTGLMYNDVFSKSIKIFDSSWTIHYNKSTVQDSAKLQLDPKFDSEGIYLFGMDPIWKLAKNKIIFLNTYKMKLSIIFGVLHMFFGVCMSVVNFRQFQNRVSIFLEFLPQALFLVLLFGYMVFMMFFKWVKYSAKTEIQADTPGCAPSVLIMFINMMLFKSTVPLKGCKEYMFAGQHTIQMIFVSIGLVCIPWMLLGKPLYIKFTQRQVDNTIVIIEEIDILRNASEQHTVEIDDDDEQCLLGSSSEHLTVGNNGNEEDEPLSEVFIHQAIHTIEYILSTISHTASYLRLWALSLAHAQLSEVLWSMVLSLALKNNSSFGCIMLYLIFAAWSMFSLAILVMMEGLSAFLHTLRLHWVEFMSKFYAGLGYAFQPFSFKSILEMEE